VVLGGGIDRAPADDPGAALNPTPLARLRYGVWLARQTGLPLAASGGTGWAATDQPAEATVMAEVAGTEFGQPMRWIEPRSRDTHENAFDTVALLAPAGVKTIVVVTNGWHMPRALHEFRAAAAAHPGLRIVPAPMGQGFPATRGLLRWMPSGTGAHRLYQVLREALADHV
ncbi:MAG TPA: YdcF family protein, partial [Burkholderiaceae bacterium]